VLPTPVFFYGLDLGDECTVEMEPGKNLLVQLNAIGRIQDDGHRDIYFELNGEPRQIMVPDLSVADDQIKHRKADPDNLHHVGAPMPGKVFRILVDVGCVVKKGDILLSTEAMKMETNVKAEKDGVVAEILIREGTQVEQGELLLILE
jgi:pyruvate carboxylase